MEMMNDFMPIEPQGLDRKIEGNGDDDDRSFLCLLK